MTVQVNWPIQKNTSRQKYQIVIWLNVVVRGVGVEKNPTKLQPHWFWNVLKNDSNLHTPPINLSAQLPAI